MRESFSPELVDRYRLTSGDFDFTPGYVHPDLVREVHPPHVLGSETHPHVTGCTHDETGFPTNDPEKSEKFLRELYDKVSNHRDELCLYDVKNEGKGRVCIVAYGSCARSARAAWRLADQEGLPVEVLHLYTLFPLPGGDHPDGGAAGGVHAHPGAQPGAVRARSAQAGGELDHRHEHGQDRRHAHHSARDPRPSRPGS